MVSETLDTPHDDPMSRLLVRSLALGLALGGSLIACNSTPLNLDGQWQNAEMFVTLVQHDTTLTGTGQLGCGVDPICDTITVAGTYVAPRVTFSLTLPFTTTPWGSFVGMAEDQDHLTGTWHQLVHGPGPDSTGSMTWVKR
jgi:hypothetical protein